MLLIYKLELWSHYRLLGLIHRSSRRFTLLSYTDKRGDIVSLSVGIYVRCWSSSSLLLSRTSHIASRSKLDNLADCLCSQPKMSLFADGSSHEYIVLIHLGSSSCFPTHEYGFVLPFTLQYETGINGGFVHLCMM
jgi:hypothetical protein